MHSQPDCDVSVIIPYTDEEECVGALSRRIAEHLRALGVSFEILAVDEDSADNSVALLSLLRGCVPELRLLFARPQLGFSVGAQQARGRTLWMLDSQRSAAPLSPFLWAHERIGGGGADLVAVPGRYVLCRRARVWRIVDRVRGRGTTYERRLIKRAHKRRLIVEVAPTAGAAPARSTLSRALETLTPARFAGFLRSRA
jgi:hypothetical protein